jgi:hypothetical protein
MPGQAYNWTCSVCSTTWALQATDTAYSNLDIYEARYLVGAAIGHPECVNETYGCMSADCLIKEFNAWGLEAIQAWVTFDQAYAICAEFTGVINPQGMYHYMAIRGIQGSNLWVANSAYGYCGVYDTMSRSQFNSLGPVQIVYIKGYL